MAEPETSELNRGRKKNKKSLVQLSSIKRSILSCTLLILIACSNLQVALTLRISSIEVPPAVMNSSQVTLVCNYELQNDQLYSVKWYKNYVEFYRFQPTDSSSAAAAAAAVELQSESPDDNQVHSKHEFELDGINLNLAKSNSTHVHLKQTNLASEGTYKCEVSADSPSFATISIERQMKVYVLPKHRLSIIDNSANTPATNHHQLTNDQQTISGIRQSSSASVHNINDIVNLTCQSGLARPAAQLSWYLNDFRIPATSKWLSVQEHRVPIEGRGASNGLQSPYELVESKLTLAFRLQPNHLLGANQTGKATHSSRQLQLVQLRCLAKLGVEFTSDSSILVSGGKTTVVRGGKQQQARRSQDQQNLPARFGSEDLMRGRSSRKQQLTQPLNSDSHLYRWPRPGSSNQLAPPSAERRLDPSAYSSNGDYLEHSSADSGGTRTTPMLRHNALVFWTNRQLRAQAEHIDMMLKLGHSNELGPPVIVAKILKFTDEFVDNSFESGSSDERSPGGSQKSLALSSSLAAAGELGAPSWPDNGTDQLGPRDAVDLPQLTASDVNQDYELNDIVQFSCIARVHDDPVIGADLSRNVHLKWYINNKEITTNLVNAFDGTNFHQVSQVKQVSTTGRRRLAPPVRQSADADLGEPVEEPSATQTSDGPRTFDKPDSKQDAFEPAGDSNDRQTIGSLEKTLQIEFSSSLFQLKELNLKCRTIVEQPLIEYESQLRASIPTSQYIEVIQQKHKVNPALRVAQRQNNARSGYQQRSRHSKASSSGASKLFASHVLAVIWVLSLTTFHLVDVIGYRSLRA